MMLGRSENFAELTERPNIIPAPYLARAQWVALQTRDALPQGELSQLLRESYDMVFAKLPKKLRDGAAQSKSSAKPSPRKKRPTRKKRARKRGK